MASSKLVKYYYYYISSKYAGIKACGLTNYSQWNFHSLKKLCARARGQGLTSNTATLSSKKI